MNIPYFGTHQDDAFLPALLLALIPTALVVLPIVLAPALARLRGGAAVRVIAFVLAAAALVGVAVEAGAGFRTLEDQRERVRTEIADRYGVELTAEQTATLIDGHGAQVAGLTTQRRPLTLRQTSGGTYVLWLRGAEVPAA